MIIVGYQAIGKSSISGATSAQLSQMGIAPLIDLESGNFWINKIVGATATRDPEWFIPYCNIAKHLSEQGFNVFTASHKVIRDHLKTPMFRSTKKAIIYPSLELEEPWIARLQTRYDHTRLDKDRKALLNAKEMYMENICDLKSEQGFILKEIADMKYDLIDIIAELMEDVRHGTA